MNHEQTIDMLSAWLDGELPPEQAQAVRRHVEQCSECAARVDELARLGSMLDALPGHRPAADFARRVRAAAESRSAEQPARRRITVLSRVAGAHPFVMRAAAGLVVLAGLVVGVLAGGTVRGGAADTAVAGTPAYTVEAPAVDALAAAPRGSLADVALAFYVAPEGEDAP